MTYSNPEIGGKFNEGTVDRSVGRVKGTEKDGEASVQSLKGQKERAELPESNESLLS